MPPEALIPYADHPAFLSAMAEWRAVAQPQPVCALAVRYAVARLLQHWGCAPDRAWGVGLARPIADCLVGHGAVRDALPATASASDVTGIEADGPARQSDSAAVSAVRALLDDTRYIVVELGDGSLIRSSGGDLSTRHLAVLSGQGRLPPCGPAGALWLAGVPLDWRALRADGQERRRVPLPTYPFTKTRHWLTPGASLFPAELRD